MELKLSYTTLQQLSPALHITLSANKVVYIFCFLWMYDFWQFGNEEKYKALLATFMDGLKL